MKVRCINNLKGILSVTIGKIYHVDYIKENGDYIIGNDDGFSGRYSSEKFEIVEEPHNIKLTENSINIDGNQLNAVLTICNSAINHPLHYNKGKYEVIEVINDWNLNFNLGNAIKYIGRAGHKDDIIQDLEKAKFYLEYEIKRLKGEKE